MNPLFLGDDDIGFADAQQGAWKGGGLETCFCSFFFRELDLDVIHPFVSPTVRERAY